MKKEWVKYICDPADRSDLKINSIEEMEGEYIIKGTLVSESGRVYRIQNGVPVLLLDSSQTTSSVESFSFEWNEFGFLYGKDSWVKGIVNPIAGGVEFFRDKVIVDAGAGSGSQSYWMAEAGAKFIFCLELSSGAQSVVRKTVSPFKDKVFVIQTDISHPPVNIKNIHIDLVYCVNVIQHAENPKDATISLSNLLSNDGYFMYNIYMERGRHLLIKILNFIRHSISKLPFQFVKLLCFFLACLIHPLSLVPFTRKVAKNYLPFGQSFKETWLDIYDILGSHQYQKFYTRKEVDDIIESSGCIIEKESYYVFLLKKEGD